MSSAEAAARYVERGWSPVPVPAGQKGPRIGGWQDLRLTAEDIPRHFNNGQNIGIINGEASGGLVAVDLDCPEAVALAGRFLGPTLTSGRASAPDSHWWYVCSGLEYRTFDGIPKSASEGTLLELRSSGHQTLVEPSVHPSGEHYRWSSSGLEPLEIVSKDLVDAGRRLAAATLIACHLPEHKDRGGGGGRYHYALALAGYLLRHKEAPEDVEKLLKAAWDAKGWHGIEKDRRDSYAGIERGVRDSGEKIRRGDRATGGRTLESMVPGLPRKLADFLGWEDHNLREGGDESKGGEEREDRRNQGDRLIGYALEALGSEAGSLFVDQHGDPHALIDGSPVPLNSRCYSWLRRLMWEHEERAVNGEYLKTAAGTLAAQAEFSGGVRELHTRAAWVAEQGALYYELRPGKVVRVGPGGWTFEARPPVLFRRFPNLKALPDPEAGGSLDAVLSLVNLKTERDRRLLAAYAVTAPLPHVGRPILSASGPMGSGKTTAGRAVKRLWDPTAPETVRYDPRDFLQKASHCFMPMLDNLSTLPDSAADTLCRLVTGEADSKRRLYTDDEDVIIELRRAVILNGINAPTDRGDVLDRSLVVELERIPDGERRTEEEIWAAFEREHPRLLGAAFDALSRAIARKSSLQLSRRPRLADWGEYAASVYEIMGWGAEAFLSDWDEVVKAQNRSTLDGSPVAQAVIRFMEDRDAYRGTSTELHNELEGVAEKIGVSVARDKAWPKSARWLWRRIQEVVPLLVASGIEAARSEEKRGTVIALRKTSRDDATDATEAENVTGKPDSGGNSTSSNGTSNATTPSNATANPADRADGGISGNSGIRSGGFWGPVSFDAKPGEKVTVAELKERRARASRPASVCGLLSRPPAWLQRQMAHAREQGCPENQLKALAASVASELHGDATRGDEILQAVTAFMTHDLSCRCGQCL